MIGPLNQIIAQHHGFEKNYRQERKEKAKVIVNKPVYLSFIII